MSLNKPVRQYAYPIVIALLFTYFGARLLFFAVAIDPTIPPDEVDHVGRSVAFSKALFIPEESPNTYRYGSFTRQPYFYYLLAGKVLLLKPAGVDTTVYLRLANLVFGFLAVLYGYLWIRLVSSNKLVQVLFLVLATNILMFVGISASVSYDNLTNLASVAALYYLTLFFSDRRAESLCWFLVMLFLGLLAKTAFVPIAALYLLILLVRERRNLSKIPEYSLQLFRSMSLRRLALCSLVLVLGALCVGLYGVNVFVFGRLTPRAEQILTVEQAMQNRIFARDRIVNDFREGRLSYEDALEEAKKIENPGNRRRAENLIRLAKDPERLERSLISPEYYIHMWTVFMLSDGLGYHGHRVIRKVGAELWPFLLILGIAVVSFIRSFSPSEARGSLANAAVIVLGYAVVLMTFVNYPTYTRGGMIDDTLQGRYLFPALMPLCGLVAYYLLNFESRRLQKVVTIVVAAVFIYGDFFFFLKYASSCWSMGAGLQPECLLSL